MQGSHGQSPPGAQQPPPARHPPTPVRRSAEQAAPEAPARQPGAGRRLLAHTLRLAWWREIALIVAGYMIYTEIRNSVPHHEASAVSRALEVMRIERALRIGHEASVNTWVTAHEWLAVAMNYYYATMHFAVTIIVAIWAYKRAPAVARRLRTAWYSMNLLALLGYAFLPLAPPRLVPHAGFIDTVVVYRTWGSWGSESVSDASNQYAAMPSMHIGWSVWCAVVIILLARRRIRWLAVLYPLATLAVIIGTANHFLLDAGGGLVALCGGFLLARLLHRRPFLDTEDDHPLRGRHRRAGRGDAGAVYPDQSDQNARSTTDRAASAHPR